MAIVVGWLPREIKNRLVSSANAHHAIAPVGDRAIRHRAHWLTALRTMVATVPLGQSHPAPNLLAILRVASKHQPRAGKLDDFVRVEHGYPGPCTHVLIETKHDSIPRRRKFRDTRGDGLLGLLHHRPHIRIVHEKLVKVAAVFVAPVQPRRGIPPR